MPDPTRDEIAAEERALQALGSPDALPRSTIDRLVAHALAAPAQPLAPVHAHRFRHWLVAVLLVGAFVSVAFVGARIVWPERRLAPLTMDYVEAIDVATNPAYEEASHLHAIIRLDEECAFASSFLRRLATASDPDLAAAAHRVRASAATLFSKPPVEAPGALDGGLVECVTVFDEPGRSPAERMDALGRLEKRLCVGLTAILVARDHALQDAALKARVALMVSRLQAELQP